MNHFQIDSDSLGEFRCPVDNIISGHYEIFELFSAECDPKNTKYYRDGLLLSSPIFHSIDQLKGNFRIDPGRVGQTEIVRVTLLACKKPAPPSPSKSDINTVNTNWLNGNTGVLRWSPNLKLWNTLTTSMEFEMRNTKDRLYFKVVVFQMNDPKQELISSDITTFQVAMLPKYCRLNPMDSLRDGRFSFDSFASLIPASLFPSFSAQFKMNGKLLTLAEPRQMPFIKVEPGNKYRLDYVLLENKKPCFEAFWELYYPPLPAFKCDWTQEKTFQKKGHKPFKNDQNIEFRYSIKPSGAYTMTIYYPMVARFHHYGYAQKLNENEIRFVPYYVQDHHYPNTFHYAYLEQKKEGNVEAIHNATGIFSTVDTTMLVLFHVPFAQRIKLMTVCKAWKDIIVTLSKLEQQMCEIHLLDHSL